MIQVEHISHMASLLVKAALAETTVGYRQIYSLMDDKPYSTQDRQDTLDAVNRALSDLDTAIYSAILADKASGLPLQWVYEVFRYRHPDEYHEIAGDKRPALLTPEEKTRITRIERERVYAHAAEHFSATSGEDGHNE